MPCLGNPESQAALPEVRLHDASSGGRVVVWGVCVLMFPIGVGGGGGTGVAVPPLFFGGLWGGCFLGFFGVWLVFLCSFGVVLLLFSY